MFYNKTLAGEWSTSTVDGRTKSLDDNRYAEVFTKQSYFTKLYPMDSKSKAGDTLMIFCR